MSPQPRTETRSETRDETPPQQPQASHEPAPPAEKSQQSANGEERVDEHGVPFDMSAHIPEGTDRISEVEINQEAKLNDIGEGVHKASSTFGDVVSQEATDAAGLTPQALAAATGTAERDLDEDDQDKSADELRESEPQGMEQDDKGGDESSSSKSSKKSKR